MPNSFNEIKEIKQRIILENNYAYIFLTNIPIVSGHLLIAPKRVVKKIEELNNEELKAIIELIIEIRPILKKVFGATGFNYAWNEGSDAGQTIPHLHIHLIPRKKGDKGITKYEPRKFIYRPGSRIKIPEKEPEVYFCNL